MLTLKFFGAANMVTGSCYLLSSGNVSILIDCGLFQGVIEEKFNFEDFAFDVSKIDYLILTHSHLDHCGLIPKLVAKGFHGKIYSSMLTKEISDVIMSDAAKLQEFKLKDGKDIQPILYNSLDAEKAISLFQTFPVLQNISLSDSCWFQFLPVGHILGATSVFITCGNDKLLFSGDIGRVDQSLIKSFNDFDYSSNSPDYVLMEALYGGQYHENRDANIRLLLNVIDETMKCNGKVIIPVFALHRAQEILELLKIAFLYDLLPSDIDVFLDSPMASEITDIYKQNPLELNQKFHYDSIDIHYYNSESDASGKDLENASRFDFPQLNNVKKAKQSMRISSDPRSVILAGSGMADGGRVVKHLYNNLENKNNAVVFVGFQAEGTLGRQLVEGAKEVQINGELVKVNARIVYLRGFSAHGDTNDLQAWLNKFNLSKLRKVILVHGEPERIQAFAQILNQKGIQTVVPSRFDSIEL